MPRAFSKEDISTNEKEDVDELNKLSTEPLARMKLNDGVSLLWDEDAVVESRGIENLRINENTEGWDVTENLLLDENLNEDSFMDENSKDCIAID